MTTTLYATITDALGDAMWTGLRSDGSQSTRVGSAPSANFNTVQPGFVAVDIDHTPGTACGTVQYLERGGGYLWAVATVSRDFDLDGEPLWWSAETAGRRYRHSAIDHEIELRSLSMTTNPAGINLTRLKSLRGDIRKFDDRRHWRQVPPLIKRAIDYVEHHRRDEPLMIRDVDPQPVTDDRYTASRTQDRSYERSYAGVPVYTRPCVGITKVGGRPVRTV